MKVVHHLRAQFPLLRQIVQRGQPRHSADAALQPPSAHPGSRRGSSSRSCCFAGCYRVHLAVGRESSPRVRGRAATLKGGLKPTRRDRMDCAARARVRVRDTAMKTLNAFGRLEGLSRRIACASADGAYYAGRNPRHRGCALGSALGLAVAFDGGWAARGSSVAARRAAALHHAGLQLTARDRGPFRSSPTWCHRSPSLGELQGRPECQRLLPPR